MDEKKKIIIEIVVFIVMVVLISYAYNYYTMKNIKDKLNQETQSGEVFEDEDNTQNKDGSEDENVSKYIEIKNNFIDEKYMQSGETVLIDFYATWCTPCKMMAPVIEEIAKEYEDINVLKVDVDQNIELANYYNIMSYPTFMIIKNGEITNIVLGVREKEFITNLF